MRIVIRADGDHRIGAGHVMRMLALGEEARSAGDQVRFACAKLDEQLAGRVQRSGIEIDRASLDPGTPADSAWLIERAVAQSADWIVVDGFRFPARYLQALKAAGVRVMVVDDNGQAGEYEARLILNQNVSASQLPYQQRSENAELLLGPAYALLRPEFRSATSADRSIAERADRILVTLGGADPENAAERLIQAIALMRAPDLRVKVLVGPSNPHFEQLNTKRDSRIEIVQAVDDMVPLMQWADLAISAAGSTMYELCCLGVPTLVLAISQAQIPFAQALEREQLAIDLGWHETIDPVGLALTLTMIRGDRERRASLSARGRNRVDGLGASRVLAAMRSALAA